jgi:hypothetical protein
MPRTREQRRAAIAAEQQAAQETAQESAQAVETVDVTRRAAPQGERVGALAGVPEGLATAIGATFLLGPVGLLLGGAQGILSRRMEQGALDKAAAEAAANQALDEEINSQLDSAASFTGATDTDQAQLKDLQTRYAQLNQLSQHPDPAVRQKAIEEKVKLGAAVSSWYEDIETTQEAAVKEQVALRKERATLHRGHLEGAEKSRREVDTAYNTFLQTFNELGADAASTQTAYRNLTQSSLREQQDGILGLSSIPFVGGSDKLSRDEMMRGAAAWYRGQTSALNAYQQARIEAAKNEGFEIDARDGAVSVNDLSVPQTSGRVGKANPNVPEAVRGSGQWLDDQLKNLAGPGKDAALSWLKKQYEKSKTPPRRPTN